MATPNQVEMILDIAHELGIDVSNRNLGALSFEDAKKWIDKGLARRTQFRADNPGVRKAPRDRFPQVPAGTYRLDAGFGMTTYQVDRPKGGKWAGYVFLNVVTAEDREAIREHGAKNEIMGAIAQSLTAAPEDIGDPWDAEAALAEEERLAEIAAEGRMEDPDPAEDEDYGNRAERELFEAEVKDAQRREAQAARQSVWSDDLPF